MKLPIIDSSRLKTLTRGRKPAELFAQAMRGYKKPRPEEFDFIQSTKLGAFGMKVVNGKLTTIDSHLK